jgi:valyl-tRNA synthetase
MNVPASRKNKLIFVTDAVNGEVLSKGERLFERLAGASQIAVQHDKAGISADAVAAVIPGAEIYIPLEDLVDIEKEIERLEKEKANLEKELERVENKLNNAGFVAKAPANVVEEERAKKVKYTEMYEKLLERISSLKK